MREIKFRVWDKEEKELIYNVEHAYDYMNDVKEFSFGHVLDEKERYEIMQYTGLKDCNGIEIYEGDILEYQYKEKIYIVGFKDGAFVLSNGNSNIYLLYDASIEYGQIINCKVIGNIYQNPELLED